MAWTLRDRDCSSYSRFGSAGLDQRARYMRDHAPRLLFLHGSDVRGRPFAGREDVVAGRSGEVAIAHEMGPDELVDAFDLSLGCFTKNWKRAGDREGGKVPCTVLESRSLASTCSYTIICPLGFNSLYSAAIISRGWGTLQNTWTIRMVSILPSVMPKVFRRAKSSTPQGTMV